MSFYRPGQGDGTTFRSTKRNFVALWNFYTDIEVCEESGRVLGHTRQSWIPQSDSDDINAKTTNLLGECKPQEENDVFHITDDEEDIIQTTSLNNGGLQRICDIPTAVTTAPGLVSYTSASEEGKKYTAHDLQLCIYITFPSIN
jgi:hypothetical protein